MLLIALNQFQCLNSNRSWLVSSSRVKGFAVLFTGKLGVGHASRHNNCDETVLDRDRELDFTELINKSFVASFHF